MKRIYILATAALCVAPLSAQGATLTDCDRASYQVTVNNGGTITQRAISPTSGVIEEFGPVVSFQLPGQPAMRATVPQEEFCIWGGHINVQRLNTIGDTSGGRR